MGEIQEPTPVLLLMAVSSRYQEALAWAEEHAIGEFGPLQLKSEVFDFTETNYYESTMGSGLKKQFLTFERLIDPETLPGIKRMTNQWEHEYAQQCEHAEPRPLNLDPGYLTLAKLVLASTKDHAHRIYLREGIFAEVTLNFRDKAWRHLEWTFPDYRRAEYQEFFTRCRLYLRDAAN